MVREHAPQIKDGKLYDERISKGDSPETAARIASAHAAGTLHHGSVHLEDRTVAELQEEAKRIGIEGWSGMDKAALVKAVRGRG